MITAVIGHRGVGKTSLLKRLEVIFSQHEDVVFKDLDFEIETMHRRSIPSIFQSGGEAEFRRLESATFEKLLQLNAQHARVFIVIGAGFTFSIPKTVHVVWLRRVTDRAGRIFQNRPRLSDLEPLEEWSSRFNERDQKYRLLAYEELTLPEGGLHDKILEEHFFTGHPRAVPHILTVLPENFRSTEFFDLRRSWGLKALEIREDLLRPTQIEDLLSFWPREKIIYSVRKEPLAAKLKGVAFHDWALELGPPSFVPEIVSLHQREKRLSDTFKKIGEYRDSIQKLAVTINTFSELLEGHRWWRKDPDRRSFLPSSEFGRWQWYRQLFGPQMPIHFFREGDGSGPDQPFLWQTLTTPKWTAGFAAVLGSPILHSWTPAFQREFLDMFAIPTVAIDVSEDEWDSAMPALQELGLRLAAVTSPLKIKAFQLAKELTPEARQFSSVNTLAYTERGWYGHNTDSYGLQALLRGEFSNPEIKIVVWGGGGTREMLRQALPGAEFVSARVGKPLTSPVNLVWAAGRNREFKWPEPPLYVQSVVDLNYSEDSPGREIAIRAGAPYKSGETMFIHQGLQQREFWKRFL